jgi:hypothetical protein
MCLPVRIGSNATAIVRYRSRRTQTRLKSRWLVNILPQAIPVAAVFCLSSKGVQSRGLSDPPRIQLVARFTPAWRTSAPASEFRLTVEAKKLSRALFGMSGKAYGGKGSRHRP